jgi:hypothetical protein
MSSNPLTIVAPIRSPLSMPMPACARFSSATSGAVFAGRWQRARQAPAIPTPASSQAQTSFTKAGYGVPDETGSCLGFGEAGLANVINEGAYLSHAVGVTKWHGRITRSGRACRGGVGVHVASANRGSFTDDKGKIAEQNCLAPG